MTHRRRADRGAARRRAADGAALLPVLSGRSPAAAAARRRPVARRRVTPTPAGSKAVARPVLCTTIADAARVPATARLATPVRSATPRRGRGRRAAAADGDRGCAWDALDAEVVGAHRSPAALRRARERSAAAGARRGARSGPRTAATARSARRPAGGRCTGGRSGRVGACRRCSPRDAAAVVLPTSAVTGPASAAVRTARPRPVRGARAVAGRLRRSTVDATAAAAAEPLAARPASACRPSSPLADLLAEPTAGGESLCLVTTTTCHDDRDHDHDHGDHHDSPTHGRRAAARRPGRCGSASAAPSAAARPRSSPRCAATLAREHRLAVVTNDIYTTEDADFLRRDGGAARRADPRRWRPAAARTPRSATTSPPTSTRSRSSKRRFPALELVLVESGGDNLTAIFSRGLVDAQIFVHRRRRRRQGAAQGRARGHAPPTCW